MLTRSSASAEHCRAFVAIADDRHLCVAYPHLFFSGYYILLPLWIFPTTLYSCVKSLTISAWISESRLGERIHLHSRQVITINLNTL